MQIAACIHVCVGVSEHVVMSMCVTHIRMLCKCVFTVACVSLEPVYESRLYTSSHGRCVAVSGCEMYRKTWSRSGGLLPSSFWGAQPPGQLRLLTHRQASWWQLPCVGGRWAECPTGFLSTCSAFPEPSQV